MESMAYRDSRGTHWICSCGLCPWPALSASDAVCGDRVTIKYHSENDAADAGWIFIRWDDRKKGFWVCPKCNEVSDEKV